MDIPSFKYLIDNRSEQQKMADHVNRILSSGVSEARFVVGYFFATGFDTIADELKKVPRVRMIIGNETDSPTKQILSEAFEKMSTPKKKDDTKKGISEEIETSSQTEESERSVKTLVEMMQSGQLEIKLYVKGKIHAKAYIFDTPGQSTEGQDLVGSSNISRAGLGVASSPNVELNVPLDKHFHDDLTKWFDYIWEQNCVDFTPDLLRVMKSSWVGGTTVQKKDGKEVERPYSPYDIYMKTAFELVRDTMELDENPRLQAGNRVVDKLSEFQLEAVRSAVPVIDQVGGVFVSDVVGVGKSYIGSTIIKDHELLTGERSLIICPKSMEDDWVKYVREFSLNADVFPTSLLPRDFDEDSPGRVLEPFENCGFVLVDESHNFKSSKTKSYRALREFLVDGKKCVFLTATPLNNSPDDIKNQLKLFHQTDRTDLDIDPPYIDAYFKEIEDGEKGLIPLLQQVLIRRTRNQILQAHGFDAETGKRISEMPYPFEDYKDGKKRAYVLIDEKKQFFPKRRLETVEYNIDQTYQGFYDRLREYIGTGKNMETGIIDHGKLNYARYKMWNYVDPEKRDEKPYSDLKKATSNMSGFLRSTFLKRLESSVFAFRESIQRVLGRYELFLRYLDEGKILAGQESDIIYESFDYESVELGNVDLPEIEGKYSVNDFDLVQLRADTEADRRMFQEILDMVQGITPEKDTKLQTLLKILQEKPLNEGKLLLFTEFQDTAQYLFENIKKNLGDRPDMVLCHGQSKNRKDVVNRFAPGANEYDVKDEIEYNFVVTTDVLSEGLNLQDCDKIINYDIHWNPVRLIQRFGRIDRIGSTMDTVYGFNFLLAREVEEDLHLNERVRERIKDIHSYMGEDSAILERSEEVGQIDAYATPKEREKAFVEIYVEGNIPDDPLDKALYSARHDLETIFRDLRRNNPEEYKRIKNMPRGVRSATPSPKNGTYVFLDSEKTRRLYLLDENGEVVEKRENVVLKALECSPDSPIVDLPDDYREKVKKAEEAFLDEIRRVKSNRRRANPNKSVKYVRDQLRSFQYETKDSRKQGEISTILHFIEQNGDIVNGALKKGIRKFKGEPESKDKRAKILEVATKVYNQYKDKIPEKENFGGLFDVGKVSVVCGEALVGKDSEQIGKE
jgi:superfamily II DNA/RNA helicase